MTVQQQLQQCSWSDVAPGWDRWRHDIERGDTAVTERLLAAAGDLRGRAVLELASGNGELAARLADEVGPDGSVLASDEAEGMVDLLVTRLRGLPQVEVARIDGGDIPAADASYDVVVCRMGLMLMPDPDRALAEVRRVLRPGGRLVAAVWGDPAGNPWLASVGMAAMMQGVVAGGPPTGPGSPFSLANPDDLRGRLAAAGFRDAEVDVVDSVRSYADARLHFDMVSVLAPPLAVALTAASEEKVAAVRAGVEALTAPYRTADGGIELPMQALLVGATA
jgi:ubiquinone/menaquinone biosynthesis C-methylase UbiE